MAWKTLAMAMILGVWGLPAAAQDWIGTFEDWNAFEYAEGGGKVCYISSTPLDMTPKNVTRGDVFMQVVNNTDDGSKNVVNIVAGYTFQDNSVTTATINNVDFRMFTAGDGAWNSSSEKDNEMVQAMIRGAELVVAGQSSRGTNTTDTYSLLGFTAAHQAMTEACGG
ncbi:MAG: hypothetical protein HOH89_02655 [Alphaproteobacteria bacterium]|jgi:hypothetical protein|nr:hypothetical protein [Alphaproteobacteria bacterium]MBT5860035.1 hypothetical protein [Alphaproteobacteria bacterium]